ncbi:MAG: NAD(P)-dependent oxidoreductase [Ktedonobacteraceae bacterium]|nr:NAD(P)-dependent oxidoreductase [Ktedonobacteraceae bacterium]
MKDTLGFLGLGQMGRPIAANLLKAGYALRAYDRDSHARSLFVRDHPQVEMVKSVGETIEAGGIVVSMVPDDQALRELVFRPDGILARLGPGGMHLSLSTVSSDLAEVLALLYEEHGCTYLSATVIGRPDVAAAGKQTIFLSGDPEAKERAMPILSTLGTVVDVGSAIAAANVAKLATNSLILAAIAAMGEAADLIERHGGDASSIFATVAASPLFGSGAVYTGYGQMIGRKDFHPALFPVALGLKDARLILQAAQHVGLEMPSTRRASHALLAAVGAGRSAEDWSVLAAYSSRDAQAATTHCGTRKGNS